MPHNWAAVNLLKRLVAGRSVPSSISLPPRALPSFPLGPLFESRALRAQVWDRNKMCPWHMDLVRCQCRMSWASFSAQPPGRLREAGHVHSTRSTSLLQDPKATSPLLSWWWGLTWTSYRNWKRLPLFAASLTARAKSTDPFPPVDQW